ncbi:uroporphyrinogen-III synthase [Dermabacteraceae bacterium P13095]
MTRVFLGRSPAAAEPVSRLLSTAGVDSLCLPLTATEELACPDIVSALTADWIVLTSARGVSYLLSRGLYPEGRIACVGKATEHAAREAWGRCEFVAAGTGADLARSLPAEPGQHVSYLRSQQADPATAETLRTRGLRVAALDIYRTVPVTLPEEVALSLYRGEFALCAVWAGSAARSLAAQAPGARTVCFGTPSARVARREGLRVLGVAAEQTPRGMADAVLSALGGRPVAN